jgi:hypothetical protein
VNETAATVEQGGAVLATCWCAKVFRGALQGRRELRAAVGRASAPARPLAMQALGPGRWICGPRLEEARVARFGRPHRNLCLCRARSRSLMMPCPSTLVCVRLGEDYGGTEEHPYHSITDVFSECDVNTPCSHGQAGTHHTAGPSGMSSSAVQCRSAITTRAHQHVRSRSRVTRPSCSFPLSTSLDASHACSTHSEPKQHPAGRADSGARGM